MLKIDEGSAAGRASSEKTRLESRLSVVLNRNRVVYIDKLDGKITEDFWERKTKDWMAEEQQVAMARDGIASPNPARRALSAENAFSRENFHNREL